MRARAVTMSPGARSLTASVYERLRADLLACRLAPGERLKIDDLCRRLPAGSSAVREALTRLAADGFVVMEPQRGFRVAPVSLDELRDITLTRCRIEALCIRDAVGHGGVEWEAGLVAAQHRLARTPVAADGDPGRFADSYHEAHTAFHEAVVAACPSPWLLRLRSLLFSQHERYRRLSRPLATVERDLAAEHAAIAEAALARDADRCAALMEAHLGATARILVEAGARGFAAAAR